MVENKRVIGVFTGSRSDRGLLDPVIDKLVSHPKLNVEVVPINARGTFCNTFGDVQLYLDRARPDVVLTSFDRREMVAAAMASFYNGVIIAHFLGGTYSFSATPDDIGRHVLSLFSHLMFVEDERAKRLLIKSGEEDWRIYISGTSHFDSVTYDYSLCPSDKEYDLLLINPVPFKDIGYNNAEFIHAVGDLLDKPTIAIGPNEDPKGITPICGMGNIVKVYRNLPRPQFLGLLKNARRFISNSSSTLYEAPYLDVEVVNPSIRNSERTIPDVTRLKGASEIIANTLADIEITDKLRYKRVRSPEWYNRPI